MALTWLTSGLWISAVSGLVLAFAPARAVVGPGLADARPVSTTTANELARLGGFGAACRGQVLVVDERITRLRGAGGLLKGRVVLASFPDASWLPRCWIAWGLDFVDLQFLGIIVSRACCSTQRSGGFGPGNKRDGERQRCGRYGVYCFHGFLQLTGIPLAPTQQAAKPFAHLLTFFLAVQIFATESAMLSIPVRPARKGRR